MRAGGGPVAGRDFAWLWSSTSAGAVAGQVTAFVLPTMAAVTFQASSTAVGLVTAASTAAYPVLGLLAGVLADRAPRRALMVTSEVLRALTLAWMPVAALLGVLDVADLVLVALVIGASGLVFDVAAQSHLPAVVPAPRLPTANARIETSTALAALVGPAAGGAAMAAVGGASTVGAAALLVAASALAVTRLRPSAAVPAPRATARSVATDVREGVRWLVRHPLLGPVTVAGTLRSLAYSATATVALLFAYKALGLAPATVGALLTVAGLAGAAGAWLSPRVVGRWGPGPTIVVACGTGAVWMLAPLSLLLPPVPVYLGVAVVSAVFTPVWNTTVTSLRQAVTPAALLGRVHATARTFSFSAVPIGALLGGAGAEVLADALGTAAGLATGLVGCGALAALATVLLSGSPVARLRSVPADGGEVGGRPSAGKHDHGDDEQATDRRDQAC